MKKNLLHSVAALTVFLLTFSLQIQVYNNEQASRIYIEFSSWDASFLGINLFFALLAIGFTIYRLVRYKDFSEKLITKLTSATFLALCLSVIKGLSFFSAVTNFVPIIITLWAPHAFWAILLSWLVYLNWPENTDSKPIHCKNGIVSIFLFFACLIVYSGYALYFCQVTMLHGDEAHYLRLTQSLLHDGDMDLTNNIGWEQESEYSTRPFGIHKAPGSPEGKIHSLHPIGLPVLLVPAYKFGLSVWSNPRLACALFMALLTSFCIPLLYIWLKKIGIPHFIALISAIIVATLSPVAYYSNQIYPDTPGLLITLIALLYLSHWQIPGGEYRSVGKKLELPLIGIGIFLLGILPFLHPRFVPLSILLGFGILAQVYYSKNKISATIIASLISIGIIFLHVSYHLAFSDDWLGSFRPGNAWDETADIATWRFSLFGHWFAAGIGLIYLAPIFLLSFVGLSKLSKHQRKSLFIAGIFYIATAGVNGLHPDWRFGYCLPGRFLITAIPIIALGLSIALPLLRNSICSLFFVSFLMAISVESIIIVTGLPESAYVGDLLANRIIEDYYRFSSHFLPKSSIHNTIYYVLHWFVIAGSLYFSLNSNLPTTRRKILFSIAILLNLFVWNKYSKAIGIKHLTSYYIFPDKYDAPVGSKYPKYIYSLNTRSLQDTISNQGGGVKSQPKILPEVVSSTLLQSPNSTTLIPGFYYFQIPDLSFSSSKIGLRGHLLLNHRKTVQAVSNYETKQILTILDNTSRALALQATDHVFGYLKIVHSGSDTMQFGKIKASFSPVRLLSTKKSQIHKLDNKSSPNPSAFFQSIVLPKGTYNANFKISGSTSSALLKQYPKPLQLALYYTNVNEAIGFYQKMAELWFSHNHDTHMAIKNSEYFYPRLESVQPIWKTLLPLISDGFNISFELPKRGTVWLLAKYEGPLNIKIDSVTLFKEKHYWKGDRLE
ncbi:MAG: phospholipid carrier-dependent glycosyltransferase [Candidatus Latescibacterota bacterium]|nr:phospholipid carrier-dependent glycosyltransferase [Candidatus Latescibacterota bacterium]